VEIDPCLLGRELPVNGHPSRVARLFPGGDFPLEGLTDGLVTDAVTIARLDDLICEQMQAPEPRLWGSRPVAMYGWIPSFGDRVDACGFGVFVNYPRLKPGGLRNLSPQ